VVSLEGVEGWQDRTLRREAACRRLHLVSIMNAGPALKSRSASMRPPKRLSNDKNFMNVEVGLPSRNSESASLVF
jgi:hypothetical protein